VKQLTVGVSLFLLFSTFSPGSLELLSTYIDADSQASFWTSDDDFSSERARGRRSAKRLQRGKSPSGSDDDFSSEGVRGRRSVKRLLRGKFMPSSLPAMDKPALTVSLIAGIREPFISPCSTSSVYQQINVYRI
jgi:hypothetical protein